MDFDLAILDELESYDANSKTSPKQKKAAAKASKQKDATERAESSGSEFDIAVFFSKHWSKFGILFHGSFRFVTISVIVLAVYYYGGAILLHKVDDSVDYQPSDMTVGGAASVDMAASLIDREISNGWTPNDPFFMPSHILDNMPSFQRGLMYAISRFALELTDQIGRSRGSSQVDPDLDMAAGALRFDGTIWYFQPSISWAPTTPAEDHYRTAAKSLMVYNRRLVDGKAIFDKRPDNLTGVLQRMSADLGSASATVDKHLHDKGGKFFNHDADNVFYSNKGRMYGYYMIMKELGKDYAKVIEERDLTSVWNQCLASLREASKIEPWLMIMNGKADSQFWPSHLTSQGFYLLRARTQMDEIVSVLRVS